MLFLLGGMERVASSSLINLCPHQVLRETDIQSLQKMGWDSGLGLSGHPLKGSPEM